MYYSKINNACQKFIIHGKVIFYASTFFAQNNGYVNKRIMFRYTLYTTILNKNCRNNENS